MTKRRKKRLKKGAKKALYLLFIIGVCFGLYKLYPILKKENTEGQKTTTTTKANTTTNNKRELNLTLIGDIMFEGLYLDSVNAGDDPNQYLSMVADKYFNKDDLTIGNLETTITDNNKLKVNGYGYEFCTPQNIIKALDNNSVDVVSTTNNHATDRGIDGINSTLDYLNNNTNIRPVGSFKTKEDRKKLNIIEKNGIKIGFVAYAMGTNDFGEYLTTDEAWRLGLFRKLPYKGLSDEYMDIMKQEIAELRQNVDVVVAIMHWGQEFQYNHRDDQKQLAKLLNDANVDIVLGSHSHCLQPAEWLTNTNGHKTLVFYSMGNFTSADNTLDGRAGPEYVKAYQLALLANIDIELDDNNKVKFNNIKTEPIINYFNSNKRDFRMIPLSEYNNDYESSHILYNQGFNKTYINDLYSRIIPQEFRQ